MLVGLILLFMALTEYVRARRGLGMRFVPPELAERVRPRATAAARRAPAGRADRPAVGAGEVGSR